jgi:hypothetical protein
MSFNIFTWINFWFLLFIYKLIQLYTHIETIVGTSLRILWFHLWNNRYIRFRVWVYLFYFISALILRFDSFKCRNEFNISVSLRCTGNNEFRSALITKRSWHFPTINILLLWLRFREFEDWLFMGYLI